MKILIKCNHCNKSFLKYECHIKRNKFHFCNNLCKSLWQKENLKKEKNPFYNKRHLDETKKIIGLKNKTNKIIKKYYCIECNKEISKHGIRCKSCAKKGKLNINYGKKRELYIRNKISISKINIPNLKIKGELHPFWRGGFPKCIDCGRELKNRKVKRCHSCENKRRYKNTDYNLNMSLKFKGDLNPCFGKTLEHLHGIECQCSFCKQKKGMGFDKNNPHYIDGRTFLWRIIRNLDEYKQWRTDIFKRDNYRCQECFIEDKGKNLEAHHIKQFSFILEEFLQQYNQFSPIEDKETLIRLAITYTTFWDISNGQTLCKECHKKIKVEYK